MGKRTKFYFNPETLNYEPVIRTFAQKLKQLSIHLFSAISLGFIFFLVFVTSIQSPNEKQLRLEKSRMQIQYKTLQRQLDETQEVLTDLQQRDNNLYRVVFQADPISIDVRKSISINHEYYDELRDMTNSEIVVSTTKKLDLLKKQLYIQSKSYDDLILLAKNKEAMLECIPAIQPVLNKDLKRIASGWGWRIDPVYHTRRFHEGMDFTAPVGTDIFATGNGTIVSAGWHQGYGNCVVIDHGYGYATLYAHMSVIKVRSKQKVNRGDVIGLVGNTGKSTGPHLHYEVRYKNKKMDPKNFYFLDLSPEEYDLMVQMSNNSGQMMD